MAAAKEAGALGHDAIMCSTLEDANSEIKTEVAAVAMTVQNDQSRRLTLVSGAEWYLALDSPMPCFCIYCRYFVVLNAGDFDDMVCIHCRYFCGIHCWYFGVR